MDVVDDVATAAGQEYKWEVWFRIPGQVLINFLNLDIPVINR